MMLVVTVLDSVSWSFGVAVSVTWKPVHMDALAAAEAFLFFYTSSHRRVAETVGRSTWQPTMGVRFRWCVCQILCGI